MTEPTTLGFLDHDHKLRANCQDCGHWGMLPLADLAVRYGREISIPTLNRSLRCAACGSDWADLPALGNFFQPQSPRAKFGAPREIEPIYGA